MKLLLEYHTIIVPTIVAVGVMVFVSYRNKKCADNHQVRISPVLCIIFNVVLIIELLFLFLLCYIPMNILFSFGFYLPACLL